MAFFNHFNPKSSRRMPMTRRSASIGTHWTSATPSVATSRARVAAAAKAPSSALRQLTVTPTTRTIVKASTNSTAEAKNAAVATYPLHRVAPSRPPYGTGFEHRFSGYSLRDHVALPGTGRWRRGSVYQPGCRFAPRATGLHHDRPLRVRHRSGFAAGTPHAGAQRGS